MPPVDERLNRLGAYRVRRTVMLCDEFPHSHVNAALVLALFDRETLLQNIVSGAKGQPSFDKDTGIGQLNRAVWAESLKHVPGCPSGSFNPKAGHHADEPGYCPPFDFSVRASRNILISHIAAAADHAVPWPMRLYVAVAGYNAGMTGALRGWRDGDPDKYTAAPRRDYSVDVIDTRRPQVEAFLQRRGFTQQPTGGDE